ncbi:MAG: hypothetical protein ABJH04_07475 [Cyclobacteriaceae bacterium]
MKYFILVFLLFVLSCQSQPKRDNVFNEQQIQWLRDHQMYDRVKDISITKKKEIAEIINTELDLQRELDSLAVEYPGVGMYLNEKRLGLHQ